MSNNLLWVLLLIVNYAGLVASFKFFRKSGLYAWIAMASILANIQVIKTIEIFGFVTTLGNIIYGSSFLATDILGECYSEEDARQGVNIGIFTILVTTVIMQICLHFTPHPTDIANQALDTIFSILPRITLASIIAYFVSQNFDVWFYHYLWRKFPDHLWVRNNGSTMISQLFDNVIFTAIAFYGVFPNEVIIQIFVTTYLMKWVVALFDTPFLYWARYVHRIQPDV
ncbi:MAG: queuosine precursor transporter [Candidatus Rifleibacteriota bacterium]